MNPLPPTYPWVPDGVGLCPVLRDADLLGQAFGGPHLETFRKLIMVLDPRRSRLSARSLVGPKLANRRVNQHAFGASFVRVLANRKKRKKLFERLPRGLQGRRFLAQGLYTYLAERHGRLLPKLEDVCLLREDKHYLEPDKIRAWLVKEDLPPECWRPLVLFACSFAILQPHDAQQFFLVLFDHDPAFRPLLADETAAALPPAEMAAPSVPEAALLGNSPRPVLRKRTDHASAAEGSGTTVSPPRPSPATAPFRDPAPPVPLAPELAEVAALLATQPGQEGSWTLEHLHAACLRLGTEGRYRAQRRQQLEALLRSEGPRAAAGADASPKPAAVDPAALVARAAKLRQDLLGLAAEEWQAQARLAELCERLAKQWQDAFSEVDARRRHLLDRLSKLGAVPWLPPARSPEALVHSPAGLGLSAVRERLVQDEKNVARLVQAHEQLTQLVSRLREAPGPCLPPERADLDSVVAWLEEAAAVRKPRLQEIALREQKSAELVERLTAAAGPEVGRRLIRETPAAQWAHLAAFLLGPPPFTEVGKRYECLIGQLDLTGLVLALLWQKDADLARDLLTSALGTEQRPRPCAERIALLAFLDSGQIQHLAQCRPETAPHVAELLFAAAFRSGQLAELKDLEPLLHLASLPSACSEFYRTALGTWHAGVTLDPVRHFSARPNPAGAVERHASEEQLRRLHQFLQKRPGFNGNYHLLRVMAREIYILPLEKVLKNGHQEIAWKQWQERGSLEEKVEQCTRASGKVRELNQTHRTNVRRYLEDFQAQLSHWRRLPQQSEEGGDKELSQALTHLRQEAEQGRSPLCLSLLGTIQLLARGGDDPALPPADFGQRTLADDDELLLVNAAECLDPRMTWSWPVALTQGAAPLNLVMFDRVRQALGLAPATLAEAIAEFLRSNQYTAAGRAAAGDSALEKVVAGAIGRRRQAIRADHQELLDEATTACEYDPQTKEYLHEVQRSLEGTEFADALEWLRALAEYMVRVRAQRDPRRRAFLEYLREAGRKPAEDAPVVDLEGQVQELRRLYTDHRLHVSEMEKFCGDEHLPPAYREVLAMLKDRIDRPSLWPQDAMTALETAEAIQTISQFLATRWEYRSQDAELVNTLVDGFAHWLPRQLEAGVVGTRQGKPEALRPVLLLAQDIRRFAPDWRVLQTLGASQPLRPQAVAQVSIGGERPAVEIQAPPVAPQPGPARERDPQREADDALREIRAFLRGYQNQEPRVPDANLTLLHEAARPPKWGTVRPLTAELLRRPGVVLPPDRFEDLEVVYAVALAYSLDPRECEARAQAFQAAYLGLLGMSESTFARYLPRPYLDDLPSRAVVLGAGAIQQPEALPASFNEQLSDTLRELVGSSYSAPAFQWFSELLWRASRIAAPFGGPASVRLADQLWERLQKVSNPAIARSHLLYLLYQLRRTEALRPLTKHVTPLEDLVADCLRAFELADSDSAVRPRALAILAALRGQHEQRHWKKNTLPWLELFHRLEAGRGETGGVPVECRPESEILSLSDEKTALLEIRLIPSLSDPPRSLRLTLGGTAETFSLLGDDDLLLKDKVVPVVVPLKGIGAAGDLARIPYILRGKTILDCPIEQRGTWELPFSSRVVVPLAEEEIQMAWPGAFGNPVETGHGFWGREHEMRRIEQHLNAPHRPRSVMVFGQRRIGKTSVIRKVIDSHPPERRRDLCCTFVDLYGLPIPPEPGSMPHEFFSTVVSALDNKDKNPVLHRALAKWAGRPVQVRSLVKNLDSEMPLADALTALAERLEDASQGYIGRLAIFLDEFDRYVRPLLTGRVTEVDELHGSLRQIVMESSRVSLVMAGSGLQKLFTEDYARPLWGSIDKVEIKPFEWEQDRPAIENTFLPAHLRDRLCPGSRFEEVARHACVLCGGEPYSLAMLGYAAARISRGHHLTPALLNRVADLLSQDQAHFDSPQINGSKFYGFLFQTLEHLPLRDRVIAKVLLTHLAQRTSTDYPELAKGEATEPPELRRISTESERGKALDILQQEGVVQLNARGSHFRIRVPLLAAALRANAFRIRDLALQELKAQERGEP